jgi:putative addiction module killer protein
MIEIVEYIASNGKNYFADWLAKIPASHANRVTEALYRMEQGNFGDHKPVGEGVMERRIFGTPAMRLYFGQDGKELIILLIGGTKHRQDKDIAKAKALWAAYKADKQTR